MEHNCANKVAFLSSRNVRHIVHVLFKHYIKIIQHNLMRLQEELLPRAVAGSCSLWGAIFLLSGWSVAQSNQEHYSIHLIIAQKHATDQIHGVSYHIILVNNKLNICNRDIFSGCTILYT